MMNDEFRMPGSPVEITVRKGNVTRALESAANIARDDLKLLGANYVPYFELVRSETAVKVWCNKRL